MQRPNSRRAATAASPTRVSSRSSGKTRLLLQLIDRSKDVFWIASGDLRTARYLSPAYEEVWARPRGSALNVAGALSETIHPADRSRVLAASQRAVHSHAFEATYRIVRPHGEVRWIQNHGVAVYAGGRPPRGRVRKVIAFAGVARDVSEELDAKTNLARTQATLRETRRVSDTGTWDWDLETGALHCSEEMCAILGAPAEAGEVNPAALLRLVHPEDLAAVTEAVEECRKGGAAFAIQHRIIRTDGAFRFVSQRGGLVYMNGRAVRMVGGVRDVTEERAAEERHKTLSSAVEQAADHVIITRRDGVIEFVNPSFERLTGYSSSEAAGRTSAILKSGRHDAPFYARLWETILSGQTFRGEIENRRKDGSVFIEDKTIAPIRGADGEITHFVSVGRDVTTRRRDDQHQAELMAKVRQGAAEWTVTFDAVEMPIAVVSQEGLVTRANAAFSAAAQTQVDRLVGSPLPRSAGEPWTLLRTALDRARESGHSFHAEGRDPATGKTWQVSASPVTQRTPETSAAFVTLARDVSETIQLQERLRRTETMSAMGQMLACVAHEVRNPLFGISATLDAFQDELAGSEQSAQFMRTLRGEIERLRVLMQDLLDFGKSAPARLEPGQIEPVVRRAIRACLPIAGRRVTIELETADALPAVLMDAPRLAQVLQNLVENAVQHSPAGGRVAVRCGEWGKGVRVQVEDQGPGLAPADLPRLFEPFFSRRRGGTGLGLSIVRRIMDEHRGAVRLENRPGGGALATIELPPFGGDEDDAIAASGQHESSPDAAAPTPMVAG